MVSEESARSSLDARGAIADGRPAGAAKRRGDETEESVRELARLLVDGEAVLLVGSGVGNDSGVANVSDAVGATLDRVVGDVDEGAREWVTGDVQPELFYSVLMECAGDDGCLGVWKCVDPAEWGDSGPHPAYDPRPSAVHLFVVACSHHAGVPVFTTNYDPLLELACEQLAIPYRVIAHTPSVADLEPDGKLKICKLHGSVGRHGERISSDMVVTTMDGISRRNVPWLDYLGNVLGSHALCLVGYSGRDIDYYPELKERKLSCAGGPDWFWFVSPRRGSGPAYPQALASGSRKIAERPWRVVAEIYEDVFESWGCCDEAAAVGEALERQSGGGCWDEKDTFMASVADKYLGGVKVGAGLFWVVMYLRMGLLGKVEDAIAALDDRGHVVGRDGWDVRKEILLLSAKTTVCRERADFTGYRASARKQLSLAKGAGGCGGNPLEVQLLDARLQIVSSYHMEIPAHLYFPIPVWERRYPTLLQVMVRYPLLVRRLGRLRDRYGRGHPADPGALIEHNPYTVLENEARVRWIAVKAGFAARLGGPFARHVVRDLEELYREAAESGNYGTALGAAVYLDRLDESDKWRERVDWPSDVIKEKSYRSWSLRDRGDFDGAVAQAEESGNVLNVVKALMGKAWSECEARGGVRGAAPLLDARDLVKLDTYASLIKPKRLRNTVRTLKDKYIA